jgi:hypothetical protein
MLPLPEHGAAKKLYNIMDPVVHIPFLIYQPGEIE